MTDKIEPSIFTPDNEPYLGGKALLDFDLAIPKALEIHAAIAPKTHVTGLTPLQQCATEIIPQGISLALSIRELIRQAYLFSALVLMRPLVERTGLMQYLSQDREAVEAWQAGWPRKLQPSFEDLFVLVIPGTSVEQRKEIVNLMNKLVHTDPKSALFNMFRRPDGTLAFASGKVFERPDSAEVIAQLGNICIRRLTSLSVFIFDFNPGTTQ